MSALPEIRQPVAWTPAQAPRRFACRSCGGADVAVVLPLGQSPLANGLLRPGEENTENRYPLEVAFCGGCSLVQLTFAPPPDTLFREYPYFSSFSDTMVAHARELAGRVVEHRDLRPSSLVVELASNDGYLLQFYRDAGIRVLGVEPALNIAKVAMGNGIDTVTEFFDADLARRLSATSGGADVIHAHNVLAHVPELNSFVEGIATLLKSDGVAVIEAPYIRDLIEKVEFDTIYHEHLCYFSLTALDELFARHGLTIFDVERVAIHGGSLRIWAGHPGAAVRRRSVTQTLAAELEIGMNKEEYYLRFGDRVGRLKQQLLACLNELKAGGASIAGYGASAKGTTLLTYCSIGRQYLDFVVDRSTVKQGRLIPGSHLPIYSPERLLDEMPEYALLLVWNFADEVLAQQAEYRRRGGQFIIPVPEPAIV